MYPFNNFSTIISHRVGSVAVLIFLDDHTYGALRHQTVHVVQESNILIKSRRWWTPVVRMAEWSKAPDSRWYPLTFKCHHVVSGLRMEAWVRIPLLTPIFCPTCTVLDLIMRYIVFKAIWDVSFQYFQHIYITSCSICCSFNIFGRPYLWGTKAPNSTRSPRIQHPYQKS